MKPLKTLLVAALAGAIVISVGCGTKKTTPAPERRTSQTEQQMRKSGRTPTPAPEMGAKTKTKSMSETALRSEVRKAADKVPGVSKSAVVVMKPTMTALVGVSLKPGESATTATKVTENTKTKVEAIPGIKKAYVTANPELVTRINKLAKDIAAGKPVSGMKTETQQIITRITPK